jgi:Fur family ferric uptake transcriptional regulator
MGVVRKTKSVVTVLNLFELSDYALLAVSLVELLNKKMNKTTVYRILERLEDEGILHSFAGKDGLTWYAKCKGCSSSNHVDSHPHFQCRECGKSECLSIDVQVPAISNHKVDSAELLLLGHCADCL